ncbi:MAG: transposase [Thermincola sp.]|jgi:hypothetical protein|nr:transposase [Thermincola sp.]MDT3704309.1 transposase [Thermincola sp.]
MLQQNFLSEKYELRFTQIFSTLQLGRILRSVGIKKSFGLSSLAVFQIIFTLVFQDRNLFRLLQSERGQSMPGKDVIYRFLNYPKYAWRRFLHELSRSVVQYFEGLTSSDRIQVFIVDDSVLHRNRSKKAELLARVHDHTIGRFIRGYSMLTLGWSDGFSFAPIDFVMLSSAKAENRHCEMQENLDKRTHGYKRRIEALLRKPDAVVQMLQNALSEGFSADYVLMDSWFTQAPLLRALNDNGLHTIGMVKQLKQKYVLDREHLSLKELYGKIPKQAKADILGSIRVQTSCGLPLKIVFVQNRNRRSQWLAILSTDISLTDAEIVRIYGMRWSIETFFKFAKSQLKLGTEFQGRSFDMLISHTTVVFSRYLILEWERRQHNDDRSLGGLFYLFCDEIKDIDLKTALQILMQFFLDLTKTKSKKEQSTLICQLQYWIAGLPSYIKGLLPNLSCES